jgi:hypothetical protein
MGLPLSLSSRRVGLVRQELSSRTFAAYRRHYRRLDFLLQKAWRDFGMILYHGTNAQFDSIDLSKCRPNKDFGKGFYLTTIESQAIEMAQRRCNFNEGGSPIIQKYEWDENTNDLQVLLFEGVSIEWAEFIVKNRDRKQQGFHDYDLVIGPIADDGVVYQINRYLQNIITLKQLVKEMKYKKLNNQYCFCTEKAIQHLKRL